MHLDSPSGWAGNAGEFIIWTKVKNDVKKVQLMFRDTKDAQIADLKIFYLYSKSSQGM